MNVTADSCGCQGCHKHHPITICLSRSLSSPETNNVNRICQNSESVSAIKRRQSKIDAVPHDAQVPISSFNIMYFSCFFVVVV